MTRIISPPSLHLQWRLPFHLTLTSGLRKRPTLSILIPRTCSLIINIIPASLTYDRLRSYASYNSPGSNLSGLSAPLDSTDDDFEFMHYTNVGSSADDFGLGIHNLGDEDSGYNPTHFQSIAGGEDFPLLEDHFGNTFVYETPASNVSSPPPHSKEPTAFYPPTADHSPGSSLGDIEQPTDSRASSVSSFHHSPRIPSTAPPGFNESLANLTFGTISNPNSPEFYARQVSSPRGVSAPIDAPSPPPSATSPPPYHSHNKSLTQPLIIPPSPSLNTFNVPHSENEQSQETAKADNMPTVTATTFSSGFLQPPQDRTALPRFSAQDSSGDNEGPAIRLIPSTPVTAGGSAARGVLRPSPLSFVPEDTSTNECQWIFVLLPDGRLSWFLPISSIPASAVRARICRSYF